MTLTLRWPWQDLIIMPITWMTCAAFHDLWWPRYDWPLMTLTFSWPGQDFGDLDLKVTLTRPTDYALHLDDLCCYLCCDLDMTGPWWPWPLDDLDKTYWLCLSPAWHVRHLMTSFDIPLVTFTCRSPGQDLLIVSFTWMACASSHDLWWPKYDWPLVTIGDLDF